jgi:hypothetical protein
MLVGVATLQEVEYQDEKKYPRRHQQNTFSGCPFPIWTQVIEGERLCRLYE